MLQAAGFLFVVLLVAGAAGLAGLVHVLVRSRTEEGHRVSDALRELEPRGGRQRFSVRLFEAALLGCVWVALSGAVLVLGPAADTLTGAGRLAAAIIAGATAVATWWAWRRGALRSPRSPPMSASDEGGR